MNIGDIVNGLAAGVGIDLSPDGKTAYYVEWSVGQLCAVEVDTGRLAKVLSGLSYPEDVLVDWDTGDIFISERTGEITKTNITEGGETTVVNPGGAPHQLVLVKESGKRYLYTVCFDSGYLKRIDVAAGTETNVVGGLGHPIGLAIEWATKTAYVTEQDSRSLIRIGLNTGTKATIHSGLTSPFYLAWDKDRDGLYCVQRDPSNSLIRINLGTTITVDTIATGLAWRPSGVAPNTDDSRIYICADQKLQVISFNGVPTIQPGAAPFEVESIQFHYDGSNAIPLKDHVTDNYLSAQPEWIASTRDEPAAYVRGTTPKIKVVFRKKSGYTAGATYAVGAIGNRGGVRRKDVTPTFSSSGLSNAIEFPLMWPLPNSIGKHTVTLEWYTRDTAASNVPVRISNTQHTICTTWKNLTPVDGEEALGDWVYKAPMLWTSEWAAGKDNEREICDALIQNLHLSNLKYGARLSTITPYVRRVLVDGIGMCGEWYYTFQHFVHCQGIFIHRRFYHLDVQTMSNNEKKWHAIVIKDGGLNQSQPNVYSDTFYDVNILYPIVSTTPVNTVNEKRYRFWGVAGAGMLADGHGINFLVYQGKLYLYDPSFGTGSFEIAPFTGANAPLPPKDHTRLKGTQLTSFKQEYLNTAIDYMLGTLRDGTGDFYSNEITVKTLIIPDVIGTTAEISFGWGP